MTRWTLLPLCIRIYRFFYEGTKQEEKKFCLLVLDKCIWIIFNDFQLKIIFFKKSNALIFNSLNIQMG